MQRFERYSIAAFAFVSLGCTSLFEFEVEQCRVDDDCRRGAFASADYKCEDRLCVAGCRRTSDCAPSATHMPNLCVEGRCVPLGTEESGICDRWFPTDGIADDAIVLGAFGPTGGAPPIANYEFAVSELNRGPGLPPTGRKIVLVVCNRTSTTDSDVLERGFQHLSETLRVPAIIADTGRIDALKALFETRNTRDVFFLAPFDSDGSFTVDRGLLWYLLGDVIDYAPAYVPLLERAASYVERTRSLERVRLAIVKTTTGMGEFLWRGMVDTLTLDGVPITDALATGTSARLFEIERLEIDRAIPNQYEAMMRAVEDFAPDIVLVLTGGNEFDAFLLPLEARLAERLPFYVLSPMTVSSRSLRTLLTMASVEPFERRVRRFVGVNVASARDSQVLQAYERRFLDAGYPRDQLGAENYYDAVYFLAYLALAASPRNMALTGLSMAQRFETHLTQGTEEVSVGPDDQEKAFRSLGAGTPIRLIGTLGPPDFHPARGTRKGAGSVYCFTAEDDIVAPRFDALWYDEATGTLEPNSDKAFCFEDF